MARQLGNFLMGWTGGASPSVRQNRRAQLIPAQTFPIVTSEITSLLNGDYYPLADRLVPGIVQRLPLSSGNGMLSVVTRLLKNYYRIRSYCIAPGNWSLRPLQEHITWTYVTEALAYAQKADESHLDAIWRNGLRSPHSRFIQEDIKVGTPNWTKEEAKQYLDRLVALAQIVGRQGQVPSPHDLHNLSGRKDDDIGAAIGENGAILHFRKGHHRMMLAKQLGVPTVSVAIHVVHSAWLQRLLNIDDREFHAVTSPRSSEYGQVRKGIQRHMETHAARISTASTDRLNSNRELAVAVS